MLLDNFSVGGNFRGDFFSFLSYYSRRSKLRNSVLIEVTQVTFRSLFQAPCHARNNLLTYFAVNSPLLHGEYSGDQPWHQMIEWADWNN